MIRLWDDLNLWSKNVSDVLAKMEDKSLTPAERNEVERLKEDYQVIIHKRFSICDDIKDVLDELCTIAYKEER